MYNKIRYLIVFCLISTAYAQPSPPPGRIRIGDPVIGAGTNQGLYVDSTSKAAVSNSFYYDGDLLRITEDSLGITQSLTKGILTRNTTSATGGLQQISPALQFEGQGFKSNAVTASMPVRGLIDMQPVPQTGAPTGIMRFGYSINSGAISYPMQLSTGGSLGLGSIPVAGYSLYASGAGRFGSGVDISALGSLTDAYLALHGGNNAGGAVITMEGAPTGSGGYTNINMGVDSGSYYTDIYFDQYSFYIQEGSGSSLYLNTDGSMAFTDSSGSGLSADGTGLVNLNSAVFGSYFQIDGSGNSYVSSAGTINVLDGVGGGFTTDVDGYITWTPGSGGSSTFDVTAFTLSTFGPLRATTFSYSGGQSITYGTYSPTLTNVANVAASTTASAQWLKVGNAVTVSGTLQIDPTTTLTLTRLGISLPFGSNLANANELGGTAAASAVADNAAAIIGDATNNRAELTYICVDVTNHVMAYTFTYRVL